MFLQNCCSAAGLFLEEEKPFRHHQSAYLVYLAEVTILFMKVGRAL